MNRLVAVDSVGSHIFEKGLSPDVRAQWIALPCGIDLSDLRTRKTRHEDFSRYDSILAMENENYCILQETCPEEHVHKISMTMEFAQESGVIEVPYPYFGNTA